MKTNLVELLRDCPTGMELDCTAFDNVTFDYVNTEQNRIYCKIDNRDTVWFTAKGCINLAPSAKCVIFPKGKTTWEGFIPFVKGDIIYTDGFVAILYNIEGSGTLWYYCYYSISEDRCKIKTDFGIGNVKDNELRLATEEEKQKLFDAIKANGYKWNAETKTLEKLIKPKFKVGDTIRHKESGNIFKIAEIDISDSTYCCGFDCIWVADQDKYELVPNKFDITTLKAFESRVLVRDTDTDAWKGAFYSHYKSKKFYTIGSSYYYQCIPYEGHEHLLDTTNDCDPYFKTWEK